MSYFLWGCRRILTLITLRSERVKKIQWKAQWNKSTIFITWVLWDNFRVIKWCIPERALLTKKGGVRGDGTEDHGTLAYNPQSKVYGTPWKFAMFPSLPLVQSWKQLFFQTLALPPPSLYNVPSQGTPWENWSNIEWGSGEGNGEIVK